MGQGSNPFRVPQSGGITRSRLHAHRRDALAVRSSVHRDGQDADILFHAPFRASEYEGIQGNVEHVGEPHEGGQARFRTSFLISTQGGALQTGPLGQFRLRPSPLFAEMPEL